MYNPSLESSQISSTSCDINKCNIVNITTEQFAEEIAKTSALFVASLYARPSLPRVFCQEMINSTKTFLECIKYIENKYKSIELNSHLQLDLNSMFHILYIAFIDYSSEYRTMLYFKTLGCIIEPQGVSIGACIGSKLMKTGEQILVTNKKICILPLEKILKKFLELPDVYEKITSNIKKIKENKIVTSNLQSKLWCSIEQQYDNDVLPLILYFDELEINNPLGSHRNLHKLGAVYCTIGGIEEEYASILENIFLVQLHNVVDYKQFGNKRIFSNLINQIIKLQIDGITINILNLERKINFVLSNILGDNLGLHAIFGLVTSFNSNYCCRICMVDKTTREKQTLEDAKLLRNMENYALDVIDQKHGILEECVFHSITNFHITQNISVDVMHDLFEGICRYDLGQLLYTLIKIEQLFSLETLNNRMRFFDFGSDHSINIPPSINVDAINKKHIIYSASEMACFLQFLGIIIGDLIPKKNKTWQLYIILRKMLSIIMSQEVTDEKICILVLRPGDSTIPFFRDVAVTIVSW